MLMPHHWLLTQDFPVLICSKLMGVGKKVHPNPQGMHAFKAMWQEHSHTKLGQ